MGGPCIGLRANLTGKAIFFHFTHHVRDERAWLQLEWDLSFTEGLETGGEELVAAVFTPQTSTFGQRLAASPPPGNCRLPKPPNNVAKKCSDSLG